METTSIAGAGGLKLRAEVGGDRASPAVLFLPGGGQTRDSWRNAADALVTAGRYVATVDLRGHGDSEWAPDGAYALDDFVEDLKRILEQLPSKPVIVGASFGGLVALTALGETTGSIAEGLVLVDVAPRMNVTGMKRVLDAVDGNPHGFATVHDAVDSMASSLAPDDPPSTSNVERALRPSTDGRYYWHWDPEFMRQSAKGLRRRYESAAKALEVPTLLVYGASSEVVDVDSIAHARTVMPKAEYVSVDGARHMLVGDRNDMFNASIVEFLERIARRPAMSAPRSGVDPAVMRAAMGCFATGVTVITTRSIDGEPVGFTANSFTSVSLDPPLVLFCLDKKSATVPALRHTGAFVVNVLHMGQEGVSRRFANKADDRFEETPWAEGDHRIPVIQEAMANYECRVHETFDGGDHHIFVGRVERVYFEQDRDPLLFLRGKYRRVHVPLSS